MEREQSLGFDEVISDHEAQLSNFMFICLLFIFFLLVKYMFQYFINLQCDLFYSILSIVYSQYIHL